MGLIFFTKFTKSLEDSNHPLLGPVLWSLDVAGMWKSNNNILSKVTMIQVAAVVTLITEFIELWFIRSDMGRALRNLSVSALSLSCVFKSCTFVLWQKDWRLVIDYASSLEKEQLRKNDRIVNGIIREYTKYSRNIMYFYWCLCFCTVLAMILSPLFIYWSSSEQRELIRNGSLPYPEILSSWAPFDKSRGYGYAVMVVEHILMCIYGSLTVASYDSNAVVLMTFFFGQLKILKENCKRVFIDDRNSQSVQRIFECHHHHVQLIKHAKILNSVLSPVLFLYIVICSLMICASATQLTEEGTTTMQQLYITEYLGALVTQLFIYCWHSNKVYAMSRTVVDGVYFSQWWSQGVRMRRNVLLLSGQMNKIIAFSAGPFTDLNISTFVAILKASYSYYTFLKQK
ncbi:odorant receptor 43a-like [Zerene cesonia]|uniref:odorant receptor 43a-like n=1 Tax=Zerene cesonia TaxID=33412 RepID=UPI0018E574B0|nr:odorant receptor 43a-like [Zerene cesonia]